MQNRYIGDVGDFGKFGLLRLLSGGDGEKMLRLGIVWYLYPDETHNEDGKHVSCLQTNARDFRHCDEKLYDGLRMLLLDDAGLIITDNRHISAVETSDLLPESTLFYSTPLSYAGELSVSKRPSLRKAWFAGALEATISADMVFLDPDNGIECASVKRTAKKGPKYVFWDDVAAFVERGQSVVIYHHLNRSSKHPKQVEDMLWQMRERFPEDTEASAVTFTRGNSRSYFVVASPQHKDLLRHRLAKIFSGPWSRHFISHSQEVH
jgi:hypothetical protein